MGLNWETNTDEYEPEVQAILPRLREAATVDDLRRLLHEEFTRMFSVSGEPIHPHVLTTRAQERLDAAAEEMWKMWIAWLKECG